MPSLPHPSGEVTRAGAEESRAARRNSHQGASVHSPGSRPSQDRGSVAVHGQVLFHPRTTEAKKAQLGHVLFLEPRLTEILASRKMNFPGYIIRVVCPEYMNTLLFLSFSPSLKLDKVCFPSKCFGSKSYLAHIQVCLQKPGDNDVTSGF